MFRPTVVLGVVLVVTFAAAAVFVALIATTTLQSATFLALSL